MAQRRLPAKLHLLSVRQVQTAGDGDHSDGGGLILRAEGGSASWVFRSTAATGRRRETGLGVAHRAKPSQAGTSLTDARDLVRPGRVLQASSGQAEAQALEEIGGLPASNPPSGGFFMLVSPYDRSSSPGKVLPMLHLGFDGNLHMSPSGIVGEATLLDDGPIQAPIKGQRFEFEDSTYEISSEPRDSGTWLKGDTRAISAKRTQG